MEVRGVGLRACGALGMLMIAAAAANAGGFAIREQSAYGQGASYAGIAAGGSLSSMFWNPATMTQFGGIQSEASVTGIFPYAANSPTAGTPALILGGNTLTLGGTSNTADEALVPSGYFSYQLNPDLWLGMSINAPFGLSVSFPNSWAGQDYAAGSTFLHTYNFTPSIAYRISNWISVGAGVQIEYAKASLSHGVSGLLVGPPSPPGFSILPLGDATLSGDGWGYGFTLGATLTPTPTTTIGIGYRSFIDQKINGTLATPTGVGTFGTFPASTTLKLPDMISLGIRQRVDPRLTLLGTVEWTNWSRIGTSAISGPPLAPHSLNLPFDYQDGWFFSVGAEYQWTDRLTVRGGVGYEISPITDDVRMPLLPDNDRFWLSAGASWQIGKGLTADLAYSHLFVRDTHIDISAASGNPWFATTGTGLGTFGVTYVGDVSAHIDIVSLALKYRWDEPAVPAKSTLYHK